MKRWHLGPRPPHPFGNEGKSRQHNPPDNDPGHVIDEVSVKQEAQAAKHEPEEVLFFTKAKKYKGDGERRDVNDDSG